MTVFELIEANGLTLHGDIEHFAELVRESRPWQGLTDDEYQQILVQHDGAGLLAFYNLVEAKLKEKNA